MIESRHTLSYCALCEGDIVLCVTCGNNCCNGGYGKGPSGEWGTCPDCPEAYDHQDAYWKDNASVKFAKDIRGTVPRDLPKEIRRIRDLDAEELQELNAQFPNLFTPPDGSSDPS